MSTQEFTTFDRFQWSAPTMPEVEIIPPGDDVRPSRALVTDDAARLMTAAGQAANHAAARGVFGDYLSRKADNTRRAHAASLHRFADFLTDAHPALGAPLADFAAAVGAWPDGPLPEASAWRGLTWGLVERFRDWMIAQGDALGSVNARLSTVKSYAKLATKAGALDRQEIAMIQLVQGYSHKEHKRIDERRDTTRRGAKKAEPVKISDKQAAALKRQPDTPQGRRDALLMAILLDMGLRVGELAILKVKDFDLQARQLKVYRPKVDKTQTHDMPDDVYAAALAYIQNGDAPLMEDARMLRGSRKGKHGDKLTAPGMSERAIQARVLLLGQAAGLEGLSPHDCRHYWATYWANRVSKLPKGVLSLQEAGGWNSLAMPRRYVEESAIANEGMA